MAGGKILFFSLAVTALLVLGQSLLPGQEVVLTEIKNWARILPRVHMSSLSPRPERGFSVRDKSKPDPCDDPVFEFQNNPYLSGPFFWESIGLLFSEEGRKRLDLAAAAREKIHQICTECIRQAALSARS